MIEDPKLLEKDMRHQLDILIAQPFTIPNFVAECGTWAILLDGLDECYGEEAQVLILRLISFLLRHYPTTPLVGSLPVDQKHTCNTRLHLTVSGVSLTSMTFPQTLTMHVVMWKFLLRAKFEEIHQTYKDLIPVGTLWPVEQDITRVSKASSGLFALATTVVRYIEDPHVCDPISQLATVVSVTRGLGPGSLSALHAFYSAILDGVPQPMLPMLELLLFYYVAVGTPAIFKADDNADSSEDRHPLAFVARLLNLQQHSVYGALSVVKVPPPERSGHRGIKFDHTSFPNYLKVASRNRVYYSKHIVIKHIVVKQCSSFLNLLCGGGSSLYQRAMLDNHLPIQLSWGSPWADSFLDGIWEREIKFLFHNQVPECPRPDEFGHSQVPLTRLELQIFFEGVDFSALLFRRRHKILFSDLFGLFEWLVSDALPELVQSDFVKMIPLGDLDLSCIPEEKLAHEFSWASYERECVDDVQGPRQRQFHCVARYRNVHRYTSAPPESLHPDWHNKTRPLEGLIPKLDQLRRDDPTVPDIIVVKGPSGCCAFICVEPQSEEPGAFFYIPYGQ